MMSRLRQPIPKRETLSRSISNSTFGELRINSVERLQWTFAPFYRPLSSLASNRSHYHYSPPWGPLPKLKSLLFLSRCHQRCLISSRGNASSERIAANCQEQQRQLANLTNFTHRRWSSSHHRCSCLSSSASSGRTRCLY